MADRLEGLQVLEEIRPASSERRFLQSWDKASRILRYGCGDESKAVQVGSDGSVDVSTTHRSTKLRPDTVKRFLDGVNEDSPLVDVRNILSEYLYFPDERIYLLISAWIAGTYVYSIFSHYGYLFLHSNQPRCGKTRTEEITSHLAFEATTPRNAPTPPTMRETAVEGGTAIFDTLERWKEKGTESFAAAMELLDAGFRNGGVVAKMVRSGDGEWKQEEYPVYAPYMFAAINKESLTDTALDRSFAIDMVRKSTRIKTRSYDATCEARCEPVRDKLYLAALTHANAIAERYESAALQEHIDALGLHDRAADIWKPVLAVADVLGPEGMSEQLSVLAQEISPDPDRQEERRQLRIVQALRSVVGEGGIMCGTTQQIIQTLGQVTDVKCPDLGRLLTAWSFTERSMRLQGIDTPRKAWELTDADLARVEERLS